MKRRVQQAAQDRTWQQAQADVERVILEAQSKGLDWGTHVVLVFDPHAIGVPRNMRAMFRGRPAVMTWDREQAVRMTETLFEGVREQVAAIPATLIPVIVLSGESVALRATRIVTIPSPTGAAN